MQTSLICVVSYIHSHGIGSCHQFKILTWTEEWMLNLSVMWCFLTTVEGLQLLVDADCTVKWLLIISESMESATSGCQKQKTKANRNLDFSTKTSLDYQLKLRKYPCLPFHFHRKFPADVF